MNISKRKSQALYSLYDFNISWVTQLNKLSVVITANKNLNINGLEFMLIFNIFPSPLALKYKGFSV